MVTNIAIREIIMSKGPPTLHAKITAVSIFYFSLNL
jgi:hypothetical protein